MATREEKNEFSALIMQRADAKKIDVMDAIITYCNEMDLEVEAAASLVNDVLKSRLEEEAQILNYIPKGARLPI
jgi:hypothetical protein